MNYNDYVLKGRILSKTYETVRYELCELTHKVVTNTNFSTYKFAKDIGINDSTLVTWYSCYVNFTSRLIDLNKIVKPDKKTYNAINKLRKIHGSDHDDANLLRLFKFYYNQSKEDKTLSNCLVDSNSMMRKLAKVKSKTGIESLDVDINSMIESLNNAIKNNKTDNNIKLKDSEHDSLERLDIEERLMIFKLRSKGYSPKNICDLFRINVVQLKFILDNHSYQEKLTA